jgi:hypothetical protein
MRYFFHIRHKDLLIRDEEGTEFADSAAARQEAQLSVRDLALDDLKKGRPITRLQIEVTDENGAVLETVSVNNMMH